MIDLFLGGPMGEWVLDQVAMDLIGTIYSPDGISGDVSSEVGLSMHYPYILSPEFLARYERIYNIHPGLLPWGRGYYPVFWALWADEPAGCTLHVMREGIDDGPIVAQRAVPKHKWDTGGSLHKRVTGAEKGLFLDYWPRIASGEDLTAVEQVGGGSFHYRKEFIQLKRGEGIRYMDSVTLLRLIRCLSHPDYTGLEVEIGRSYEVSMR